MKYYVLQVQTGKELAVLKSLTSDGFAATVPRTALQLRRGGAWHSEEKALIPGYVFVMVKLNTKLYYKIKNRPYVIAFIGKGTPTPLPADDVRFVELISNAGHPVELAHLSGSGEIIAISKRQRRAQVKIRLLDKEHIVTLPTSFQS